MSVFAGIEMTGAENPNARAYFLDGNYRVRVNSVLLHKKRLGGTPLFIVETTVIESDNLDIEPGEQRNWR